MTRRRALCQLAAVGGCGVATPAALLRVLPPPEGAAAATSLLEVAPEAMRRRLQREAPSWILLGNSMLNSRIRADYLEAVSAWKIGHLGVGGTQSALWWLIFKNIVVGSAVQPRWVTVFFRESDLTWPDYRLDGENDRLIRRLLTSHEPEWESVLGSREDFGSATARAVRTILKGDDYQLWARWHVRQAAYRLTDLDTVTPRKRRAELNQLFALRNTRRDVGEGGRTAAQGGAVAVVDDDDVVQIGLYQRAPQTFDPSPRVSFLPHVVALAQQQGIRLHFHRVKRRPAPDGTRPDAAHFQRYLADLRAWLAAHDCAYTDETGAAEITQQWYRDGDHLEEGYRERYAAVFWQLTKALVGPPPPPPPPALPPDASLRPH